MNRELYAHQKTALDRLPFNGGYLAFEQGLGKTVTIIRHLQRLPYKRVLVVCPAVAIGVWDSECRLEGITPSIPRGSREDKAMDIGAAPEEGWVVVNYEALLGGGVEAAIAKWDPEVIIVDEAQKIKNSQAKRSKVLHRLSRNRAAFLLSGTPITKNLLDLYSQYKAIDPGVWDGISWTRFKQTYAIMGGYGGYEVVGYRDVDDLKARIAPFTIVARKEDTLDLPEKTFTVVPVTIGSDHWSTYAEMAKTGVAAGWVTTTPLEKALRLSQIAGQAKLQATAAFVKDLVEAGEQVVVYFRFRAEGDSLSHLLGDIPQLTGDTPAAERTRLVQDFQSGITGIFLAQVTAGSTAITLTSASHMVYHSLSYAYEDWAQSQDRIHRIGQADPCFYYYMTAVGPLGGALVDQLVLNSIATKDDLAGVITRDPSLLLPKELT